MGTDFFGHSNAIGRLGRGQLQKSETRLWWVLGLVQRLKGAGLIRWRGRYKGTGGPVSEQIPEVVDHEAVLSAVAATLGLGLDWGPCYHHWALLL